MVTKADLMATFRKQADRYWKVPLFQERGFTRRECLTCRKFFWTLSPDRRTCADSSCEPYGFIGRPLAKKAEYVQLWKDFERFFRKEGHASIARYPVVDRWRPDLYFTIASIQDFQRIDQGQIVMEYPADPLVVPQVCLRFSDIGNVGVTGRHHTSFVMAGQHSFGAYWKERCIELNFRFLTEVMRIPEEELIYTEDLWAMPDYSQFGPSLETVSRGLELVNSVFSQFTRAGSGFTELPVKVIDVGWGYERLVWFSQGTRTGYDAVFGPVAAWAKRRAGVRETDLFAEYARVAGRLDREETEHPARVREQLARELGVTPQELAEAVEPLQAVYAIVDHAKTLLFALTDGAIPSNVGGGYNLRVILRRSLSFLKEQGFTFSLADAAGRHATFLKRLFPELRGGLPLLERVLAAEEKRYEKSLAKARGMVVRLLGGGIGDEQLVTLYTSHGITPELVQKIAQEEGRAFTVPEGFYRRVTEHHLSGKKATEAAGGLAVDVTGLPATELLYYRDPYQREMQASVVGAFTANGEHWAALDRTVFYPEGGGQPADHGTLKAGGTVDVLDVQKVGKVVLHKVSSPLHTGATVAGVLDWDRRSILMKMHDATHIMAGACRKVLGNGAWQAGAQKGVSRSRLDVTHFRHFTPEEVEEIERVANDVVKRNIPITASFVPRQEAEAKHGFVIYQGGASPGSEVRLVDMPGHDVEACGGTHSHSTGGVGRILITKAERIQDGVNRLEFTCGQAADTYVQEMASTFERVARLFQKAGVSIAPPSNVARSLGEAAAVFSAGVEQLPATVERFLSNTRGQRVQGTTLPEACSSLFAAWKEGRKLQEKAGEHDAKREAASLVKAAHGTSRITAAIHQPRAGLVKIASAALDLQPDATIILANEEGEVVGMSRREDIGTVVAKLCRQAGGAGGGKGQLAQGKADAAKLRKLLGL